MSGWKWVVPRPCSSGRAHVCWSVPPPVCLLWLWPRWLFHCLSSWLQSLSGCALFPYFHVPSPLLDCRKLGGMSKLLPQVCVTLRHVGSMLLLSTPHWGPREASRPPFPTCQGTGVSCAPSPCWERRTLVSWSLLGLSLGMRHRFPLPLFPHSTLDKLEKDLEHFLRNSTVSKPAFLLISFFIF